MTIDYGSVKSFSNIVVGKDAGNGVSYWNSSFQLVTGLYSFDLYRSNDNNNWTFLKSVTFNDSTLDGNIVLSSPVSFQYLRFVIKSLRHMNRDPSWIPSSFQSSLGFVQSQILTHYGLTLSAISVSSGLGTPTTIVNTAYPQYTLEFMIPEMSFTMTILNPSDYTVSGNTTTEYQVHNKTYIGNTEAIPGEGAPTPAEVAAYNAAYTAWQTDNASLIAAYNTAKAVYDAALAKYNAMVAAAAAARLQVTALQAPYTAAVAADAAYRAAAAEAAAAQAEVTAKANLRDAAAAVAAPLQAAKSQAASILVAANAAKVTALAAIPAEPAASVGPIIPAIAGEWIQIDYGTPSLITQFNHDVTGGNCGLREVNFYGSNNSSDSFTFITNKTYTQEGGGRDCVFPNGGVTYRYLRLVIKSLSANGNMHYPNIYVFGGDIESNGFRDDRLTLSSISVSDGLTNNFGQIYESFPTNTNSFGIPLKPSYDQYWAWATNWNNYNAVPYSGPTIAIPASRGPVIPAVAGEWIQIDYGTPSLITQFNHDNGGFSCTMHEVDFYGSNNSSDSFTFIVSATYTRDNDSGGLERTCIFPNGGVTYRYLRLVIKSLLSISEQAPFISSSEQAPSVITCFGTTPTYNGFKDDRLTMSSISVSAGLSNVFGQISGWPLEPRSFTIPIKPSYGQYWTRSGFNNNYPVQYSGPTIAIPAIGSVDPVAYAAWQSNNASLISAYNSALAAYNAAVAADNTATSNLAPKLALFNTAAANLDAAASIYATKNAAKMAIVNGNPTSDVYATVMADSFNCASDARLKKDVVPLEGALDKIDAIRGVHYHWIDAAQPQERQVGVIAQEIQGAYPELVREGGNGFLSVDYPKLTAVLIQSIKELKAMVLDLANK